METLYRKVAVNERKPNKSGSYFSNEGEVFYSSAYKEFQHNYDSHTMYPDWWLEPIKTDQTQIEKLEAGIQLLHDNVVDCDKRSARTNNNIR